MRKIFQDDWFQVGEITKDMFMISEPHHFEEVKSYLVVGRNRAALIDTGMGIGNVREVCCKITDRSILVINTHSHWDHIGGNALFSDIVIHSSEKETMERGVGNDFLSGEMIPEKIWGKLPDGFTIENYIITSSRATMLLKEGDTIDLGGIELSVLHTPGHTQGSICLLEEDRGILFAGDTIYEGPLYAHFENSNLPDYFRSSKRLCDLSGRLEMVLPAHNRVPLKPSFLCDVASAFERLLSGEVRAKRGKYFSEASFKDFSILFK